jgi:hypothetical protein
MDCSFLSFSLLLLTRTLSSMSAYWFLGASLIFNVNSITFLPVALLIIVTIVMIGVGGTKLFRLPLEDADKTKAWARIEALDGKKSIC